MTPQRSSFQPYFRSLADAMALKDWTVIVKDEAPTDADAIASIQATEGRKRAQIRLSEGFLRDVPSEQRHTAVHELIHLHLNQACRAINQHVQGDAYAVFHELMELGVDGLADAIAPLFHLPDQD